MVVNYCYLFYIIMAMEVIHKLLKQVMGPDFREQADEEFEHNAGI